MPNSSKRHSLEARTRRHGLDSEGEPRRRGGNLFLWTVLILFLIVFVISCWIGSFHVFGHPEDPFSYSILTKLKKLDPPKRFEITSAPRGEFLRAEKIFDRYSKMPPSELKRLNESLFRNYLRNYRLTQDLVPYAVGNFTILDSYELSNKTLFPTGVVALAQSNDDPGVLIEHVFPADPKLVPVIQRSLLSGLGLPPLNNASEMAAIIHIEKLPDGRLQLTTVPIQYDSYTSQSDLGTFSLEPPGKLNVEAGLPILNTQTVAQADEKYAGHRQKAGLDANKASKTISPLVRVERPTPVNGTPPPEPVPPPEAIPVPTAATVAEMPVPPPTPSPAPTVAPPSPTPTPAQVAATSGGKWPVYNPGQMPRGRLLNIPDMQELSTRGVAGERIYLQGNFVVTASGGDRAVLRAQGALAESLGLGGRSSKTRVIVEFPSGSRPPSEGSTFSRDSRRPFQITEIRRGDDGLINVYAREVTRTP